MTNPWLYPFPTQHVQWWAQYHYFQSTSQKIPPKPASKFPSSRCTRIPLHWRKWAVESVSITQWWRSFLSNIFCFKTRSGEGILSLPTITDNVLVEQAGRQKITFFFCLLRCRRSGHDHSPKVSHQSNLKLISRFYKENHNWASDDNIFLDIFATFSNKNSKTLYPSEQGCLGNALLINWWNAILYTFPPVLLIRRVLLMLWNCQLGLFLLRETRALMAPGSAADVCAAFRRPSEYALTSRRTHWDDGRLHEQTLERQ